MSDSSDSLSERARQASNRNPVRVWASRKLGHDDEFSESRFRAALARAAGAATVRQLLGAVPAASYHAAARVVAGETPHLDAELVEVLGKASPELIALLSEHRALGGESWQRLDGLLADYFEDVFPDPNVKDAEHLVPVLEALGVLLERGLFDEGKQSLRSLPAPSSAGDASPAEIVKAARASVPALRDEAPRSDEPGTEYARRQRIGEGTAGGASRCDNLSRSVGSASRDDFARTPVRSGGIPCRRTRIRSCTLPGSRRERRAADDGSGVPNVRTRVLRHREPST